MLQTAGGTPGETRDFFLGVIMFCGGIYMLLQSIVVTHAFSLGYGLYSATFFGSATTITSGMILIPFIFGTILIFYDYTNKLGWLLTVGSITALLFGVISSIHFTMRSMSLFDLIIIFILTFGGIGLFLKSLRS